MKGAKSPLRVQSTRIFKLFRKFKNTHSVAKRLFRHAGAACMAARGALASYGRPPDNAAWVRAAMYAAPTPFLQKIYSRPVHLMGREYAAHTSWCHPRSGKAPPLMPEGAGALGSAGVLPGVLYAGGLQPGPPSLGHRTAVLLPRHGRRNQRRERLGRIISRQSRSPRWRPRISISAEARLVAQGTL